MASVAGEVLISTNVDTHKFDKKKIIHDLIKHLNSFDEYTHENFPEPEGMNIIPGLEWRFCFSNEEGLKESTEYLNALPSLKSPDRVKIGIFVGPSFLLSRLPELEKHFDLLLMVDILDPVLEHNSFLVKTLLKSRNTVEFIGNYVNPVDNPLLFNSKIFFDKPGPGRTNITAEHLVTYLLKDPNVPKDLHFMKRYPLCREAALRMPVATVCLDLLNKEQIDLLLIAIKSVHPNCDIDTVYISNVTDYDANKVLQNSILSGSPVFKRQLPANVQIEPTPFNWNQKIIEALNILLKDSKRPQIMYSTLEGPDFVELRLRAAADSVERFRLEYMHFLKLLANRFPWVIPESQRSPLLLLKASKDGSKDDSKENTGAGEGGVPVPSDGNIGAVDLEGDKDVAIEGESDAARPNIAERR